MAELDVTVNGEAVTLPAGSSVADLVIARGLGQRRIAVERNGEIVPRSLHAVSLLSAGDRLEIVHAIGGG